jgi:tetratricopeptide (TPR) repeat protein
VFVYLTCFIVSSPLPFSRNEFFVGREDQLQSLETLLFRRDYHQRVTIFGLGGCGKSALALECAYRAMRKDAKYLVFWVPAISKQSFELAFRDIGILLHIPGITDDNTDVLELVRNKLDSDSSGDWLMIIDNADDASILLSEPDIDPKSRRLSDYLPRSDRGRIIFTTRSRKAAENLTQSSVIKLDDMGGTEARQLMAQRLEEKALLEDETAVDELLGLLAYLPLAIVQATAFINSNGIAIADYISLFREPSTEARLFSKHFEDPSRYREMESTIAKTWYISFNQILKQDRLAADYLSFMACIDRVNIPLSLLSPGDSLQQIEAIGTLKGHAFITERHRLPQQSKEEKFFDIHRLVQMASMWWLQEDGNWTTWTNRAAVRLQKLIPHGGYERKEIWTAYLSHAVHVTGLEDALDDTAKASLLDRVGRCQESLGQYSASEMTHREVLALRKKSLGDEHIDTFSSINQLGISLSKQGRYQEAELTHRQTLPVREKLFGNKHPGTLSNMSNLALVLGYRGKYEEAESMYRQTLTTHENVLGIEHPDTVTTMDNLAIMLERQGKHEEAESIHKQTLATRERVLGTGHPSTLSTMNNLALVLGRRGKYEEAESMHRQSQTIREKVLGVEHPNTMISVYCLAYILSKQHRYEESTALYEKACLGLSTSLGKDHLITRSCCEHYSRMLASQKQDPLDVPLDIPHSGVSRETGKGSRLSRGFTKMGFKRSKN